MEIMFKTGIGFDVHAFEEDGHLVIGGVNIPFPLGLKGHSDADVLAHAVTDALVGVGLGTDIGGLFPDTDPSYKGADSLLLLKEAVRLLKAKGWRVGNVDSVIIAQVPKMAPHIPTMCHRLAACLEVEADNISVKATTTEYLGFTGRKEGIAALAVATIYKDGVS